jgi:hypothetical protein
MPFAKILIAIDSSAYALSTAKKGFGLTCQLGTIIEIIDVVDTSKVLCADLGLTHKQC